MSTSYPDSKRCPCGTGLTYGECCGRYHAGVTAPTAETLMRSRFTAFAVGDSAYLLRTWAAEDRPETLELTDTGVRFYRLDILDVVGGGPLDETGVVEFEAFYKGAEKGSQHERSSFRRVNGEWVYAAGDVR
ncbi:YchJ family protein [Corynebacterium halotolerans]|uniref:YchJ family protein n=1 Tax=Corynebacterium halotolerans TaxID=225326 RepID=UPI003CF053A9